jgi:hypothetical protein
MKAAIGSKRGRHHLCGVRFGPFLVKKGLRHHLCEAPFGLFLVQKGVRHHLCEAPFGPFRQMVPDSFLNQANGSCPLFEPGKWCLTPF